MRRFRLSCLGALFVMLLVQCRLLAAETPAVLICSPKGAWQGHVDLDWLRQLDEQGIAVDYLDAYDDFSWERVSRYNCLVLYGAPAAEEGERNWYFPATGPRLDDYRDVIERFLAAGGGVLMMVDPFNADQDVKPLIAPWGARVPYERYVEHDPEKLAIVPRMRGNEQLSLVDQILPSPISDGVTALWLPYGERYSSSWSAPIAVSDDWQVVVKGSTTSRAEPVDEANTAHAFPKPADAVVRPGGVDAPALIALRPYKQGRIFFLAQGPQFSIGQGTQWLYNRRVLSRGLNNIPSDFERLIVNAFRWLSAPSLESEAVGGYTTDPLRLMPPNLRPGVKEEFEQTFWSDKELDLHRPPRGGTVFRGLIGARTELAGGKGSVEAYAQAAKEAGLDFVVFTEPYAELKPEAYEQLRTECKRLSSDQLLLVPGYRIDTNTGNHMFFAGFGMPLPRENILTGPKKQTLMLQYQEEDGTYTKGPNTYLQWVLYDVDRYEGGMVGYYLFDDPRGQQVPDLRLSSAVAVKTYRDGTLVDEQIEPYLVSTAGTLPSLPVAMNLVDSPAELKAAVAADQALTYAQGKNLRDLTREALRWNSQYDGMNVFASDGPIIRAWPQTYRAYTYGAEPFVVNAELMRSELHVTSDVGLREIRVFNGDRVIRRFLPGGDREFRQVLHLPGHIQATMSVVATDLEGDQAVSFSRRCWRSGSFGIAFCGDHVNDCKSGGMLLGRGPNTMLAFWCPVLPEQLAGFTWDGGPPPSMPLTTFQETRPRLETDQGTENGADFAQIPLLEFADDAAVAVTSRQDRIYDREQLDRIVNPWHTFGPIRGNPDLMTFNLRYRELYPPTVGVPEYGWAGPGIREGMNASLFRSEITFLKPGKVKRAVLMLNRHEPIGKPAMVAWGRTPDKAEKVVPLAEFNGAVDLRPGDWIAYFSPNLASATLLINRANPVTWELHGNHQQVTTNMGGLQAAPGMTYAWELFAASAMVSVPIRSVDDVTARLSYLANPTGMQIRQGTRVESPGFIELDPGIAKVVEVSMPRPQTPLYLTVPLRIPNLNRRWTAGLWQIDGYVKGDYGKGQNRYRPLGIDDYGFAYVPLYVDKADPTHVVAGHPVTANGAGRDLFRQVTLLRENPHQWHIAVNNPTDKPITTTLESHMDLPNLVLPQGPLTIAPGEHRVIR